MSDISTKRRIIRLLALFVCLLSSPMIALATDSMSAYVLGPGDTIRIQVYGEPDLDVQTQVSDTGILAYPFLGDVRINGMTVGQLHAAITDGLKGDYLLNPKVTVSIFQYRNFYVNGEVARPGGFAFQPGLTVRKAVSLAGGFTDRASRGGIYIITEKDPQQMQKKVGLNASVHPGDIITIEQSFF